MRKSGSCIVQYDSETGRYFGCALLLVFKSSGYKNKKVTLLVKD